MPRRKRNESTSTNMFVERDVVVQILAIFLKPNEPFVKAGESFQRFVLIHFGGNKRQQTDKRSDFQRHIGIIEPDCVVIKTVLLVPKPAAAEAVDGIRNLHKMLEKF